MKELEAFNEPELRPELPRELEQRKFEIRACLKLDDGYAAYLIAED